MGKIGKLTAAIKILKSKPHLINQIIEHDSVFKDQVVAEHGLDKGLRTIDFLDIVTEKTIPNYLFLDGGSLITDLLLLRSLAKNIEDCHYFEIGTWRGESVTSVADLTKTCTTFNLPNEDIGALGHDQVYLDQLELLSKGNPNIIPIKGNSKGFDFQTIDNQPNLVFIDGDHHYDMVKSDSAKIFDWINPKEATIVWHDYGNSPEKVRWSVLKGILDGIPIDQHQYLYHVANTKCAIYTQKPFKSNYRKWPENPCLNFKPSINPESI